MSKHRSIAQISPEIRSEIRQLVTGNADWPLVLIGDPGTGKTCAGLALLDHAGGLYFTAAELSETTALANAGKLTREGWSRNVPLSQLRFEIERTTLVFLDELASRSSASEWHFEQVLRLLDAREGKPLIVASNHPLDIVGRIYDDRVVSRLAAGTVLFLAGNDRRRSGR